MTSSDPRIDSNFKVIPTIGGIRQRGKLVGYAVSANWPVGEKTVVLYLGEREWEGFPRPWVHRDKAKIFDTDEQAYGAANSAELSCSHPILVQPLYERSMEQISL